MTLHVRGRGLPDGQSTEWWIVDGTLSAEPVKDAQTVFDGGWIVPGLVDAHCHVGLGEHGPVEDIAECVEQAETERGIGALLLRDCGSPIDTRSLDDRDDLPRIIRAGRHIARSRRYLRGFAHELEPEDVVAYVRQEARRGDGWVKLVGDWIDRDTGDLSPSFPRETVVAAVAAAHEEGARTTAHCFGEESLYDFAAAGTDCIEHACGLEPESIEQFAAQGIAIVPTLINIARLPEMAAPGKDKFPAYYAHMMDLHRRRYATVAAAHDAGVPIYLGTDAGSSLPHGLVADEAADLVAAGLSTVEALSAGTWAAREWLGRPGIEEGASADLVVYAADPRTDIKVLAAPLAVVLRGQTV